MNKDHYQVYGIDMSPYSVKVRSYFRYKGLPHTWITVSSVNREEVMALAKLPLVPVVVGPDGAVLQDSTPVLEALDSEYPDVSIYPDDPFLRFINALVEEFGDEWGNKLMFHHRWYYKPDQIYASQVIARANKPDASIEDINVLAASIQKRMVGRIYFVGSSDKTAPLIERYFLELLDILEAHLTDRLYLFGDCPTFADFGLAPQFYEMFVDPTCGGIMRVKAPNVSAWCLRMLEPRADGPLEDWSSLAPTMEPLLTYIGTYFLPWSDANAKAIEAGEQTFSVTLAGENYEQQPQKYHAKSLKALREKYQAIKSDDVLGQLLSKHGCLAYLEK